MANASVVGLKGLQFVDNTSGSTSTDAADAVTFAGEVRQPLVGRMFISCCHRRLHSCRCRSAGLLPCDISCQAFDVNLSPSRPRSLALISLTSACCPQVDRTYIAAPAAIKLRDSGRNSVLLLHKRGFADAVVWNPAEASALGASCGGALHELCSTVPLAICIRMSAGMHAGGQLVHRLAHQSTTDAPTPLVSAGQGSQHGRPGCGALARLCVRGGGAGAQRRRDAGGGAVVECRCGV